MTTNALLKEVDVMDQQEPFRADWESLRKYEVPDSCGPQKSS